MTVALDHLILNVNDAKQSIEFYTRVLGFAHDGEDGPFSILRVTHSLMLLLAPFGTKGGEHLAFSMTREEFEQVFERIQRDGVAYGDAYDTVGSQKGPGEERSARGIGTSVYFFDPNKHLLEIVHYEA
jgi:catechol 2,3-dioxygenase-like lactoylglutathione lyase family enzyme